MEDEAKEEKVDLEKMTRRQRMAYMAQQKPADQDMVDIGEHNKTEIFDLANQNENMFFSLGSKRHLKKDNPEKTKKSALT